MAIICPQCGKDDMIQKVSAIYSAGIASGSYSGPSTGVAIGSGKPALVGGYTTVHGTSQTALSSKLSPPVRPSAPSPVGWIMIGGLVLIGIWTLINIRGEGALVGFGFIGFAVLLVALGGKGETAKKQAYQQAMQKWNHAIAVWDRLYYCARNDCIFDPSTEASVPADRMYDLLYR